MHIIKSELADFLRSPGTPSEKYRHIFFSKKKTVRILDFNSTGRLG